MPAFERCSPDAIPGDAVVVSIWEATGRTVADVACWNCPKARDYIVADFPRPVPIALQRAEEIRRYCGLARVVVVFADDRLWNRDWGTLTGREKVH